MMIPLWLPRARVEPYLAVGHYEFGPQRRLRTLSVADAEAIRAGCGGGQAWLRPAMDNMTLSTSSAATRRRGAILSSAMRTFAPIPPAQLAVSSRSPALRRSKSRHHHHPPGGDSRDVDARDHLDRWDRRPALRLPVRAMEHRIRKATWRQAKSEGSTRPVPEGRARRLRGLGGHALFRLRLCRRPLSFLPVCNR